METSHSQRDNGMCVLIYPVSEEQIGHSHRVVNETVLFYLRSLNYWGKNLPENAISLVVNP